MVHWEQNLQNKRNLIHVPPPSIANCISSQSKSIKIFTRQFILCNLIEKISHRIMSSNSISPQFHDIVNSDMQRVSSMKKQNKLSMCFSRVNFYPWNLPGKIVKKSRLGTYIAPSETYGRRWLSWVKCSTHVYWLELWDFPTSYASSVTFFFFFLSFCFYNVTPSHIQIHSWKRTVDFFLFHSMLTQRPTDILFKLM